MFINKVSVIRMVKIYSTDDDVTYLSIAGITAVDDTQEYILVFPVFAEQPLTFKFNSTHQRYEHSNREGVILYVQDVARIHLNPQQNTQDSASQH